MRTPFGKQCGFFYGNYFRGRESEECRLLGKSWLKELCRTCSVPLIEQANACENMVLNGEVIRPLSAVFQRRVRITASCKKTNGVGFNPYIGCGKCHPFEPILFNKG